MKKKRQGQKCQSGIYQSKHVLEWHISNFGVIGGISPNVMLLSDIYLNLPPFLSPLLISFGSSIFMKIESKSE